MAEPAKQQTAKPYPLTEDFQRLVATLCACRPSFWGRIGHQVNADLLTDANAKRVMQAVKEIAAGRAPDNVALVVQHLAWKVHQGVLVLSDMQAARSMLLDVQEPGLPDDDGVVAELRPVISKQIRDAGIREAITKNHTGDIDGALELLQASQRVGAVEQLTSQQILPGSAFEAFDGEPPPKLTSGVAECDQEIGGGFEVGQLIVYGAEPGIGKSMTLNNVAVCSTLSGINVACATLELTERFWRARYLAGVTDTPLDEMLVAGSAERAAAVAKLGELHQRGLGQFVFKYFEADETTLLDIQAWVAREEARMRCRFHVVLVDTLDHVAAPPEVVKTYPHNRQVTHVYRKAMHWARKDNRWLYTASQVKAGAQEGKKRAGSQDMSDSAGKGRTTDSLVTFKLNDAGELEGWVAKNRNGRGLVAFGPLATAYARGQLVQITEYQRTELLTQALLRKGIA